MSRANSEIIRAWADGSDIQYQQGGKWIDFDPTQLPWSMDRVYRVKPDQKWYRVAKIQQTALQQELALATTAVQELVLSRDLGFVGWVSDRVYLEIDE